MKVGQITFQGVIEPPVLPSEVTPFERSAAAFVQHLKDTEGDSVPDAIRRLRAVREILTRWNAHVAARPEHTYVIDGDSYLREINEVVKR